MLKFLFCLYQIPYVDRYRFQKYAIMHVINSNRIWILNMYLTVTRDNACNPLTSPSNHTPTHLPEHPPQTHTLCKMLATPFDPVIKGCIKHISGNYVDRREILLKDKQVLYLENTAIWKEFFFQNLELFLFIEKLWDYRRDNRIASTILQNNLLHCVNFTFSEIT